MFLGHRFFYFINKSLNGHKPSCNQYPQEPSERRFATEWTSYCHFEKTEPFLLRDIDLNILSKPADVMYQIKLFYLLILNSFHLKVRPIY